MFQLIAARKFQRRQTVHAGRGSLASSRTAQRSLLGGASQWVVLLTVCLSVALCFETAVAADWNLQPLPGSSVKLVNVAARAKGARIHLQSASDFQPIRLRLPQPESLVHDDFQCSIEIRTNQMQLKTGLEVVLPRQKDPRTNQPVVTILPGTAVDTEQFAALTMDGSLQALDREVQNLRLAMGVEQIDSRDAYVRAILVTGEVHAGDTFVDVQKIDYGPIVKSSQGQPAKAATSEPRRLAISRDRITIDGRPSLLTFLPDHGEPVELFLRLGVDAVWAPDLGNQTRIQQLSDAGLLVMATPPHPEFDPANFSVPLQGLPPLHETYAVPDIWYLGTSIEQSQLDHLLAWAREIRSADRKFRRPLMADVRAAEGVASRQIDFVGITDNVLGGLKPFGLQRNRSYLRKNQSAQLVLPWEWIHTQPPQSYQEWFRRMDVATPELEPEQILMQTIAAVSAGSKGIGYWKAAAFRDSDRQQELLIAIELSNLYLEILEPILVGGQVQNHIRTNVSSQPEQKSRVNAMLNGRTQAMIRYDKSPTPDAALVDYSGSTLIVAANWDDRSHAVPHPMRSPDSVLTVAANETASAWMVSATGMKGLRRQTTAGGLNLNVPIIDMFAFALVTSDITLKNELQKRIFQSADRGAELFLKLARLKLRRVAAVVPTRNAGPQATFVRERLRTAESQYAQGEQAFGQKNYVATETNARNCLANLRQIQSILWAHSGGQADRVNQSPELTGFDALASLPALGNVQERRALSQGGDFESLRDFSEFGWQSVSTDQQVQTSVNVVSELGGRNQALRMRSWSRESNLQVTSGQPPLLILSPNLDVQIGDVVQVSGRIRLGQAVSSETKQPFLIFDSDMGPEVALRPQLSYSWKPFQLERRVSSSEPFRIWMGLSQSAEVYLDDLTIVRLRKSAGPIQRVSGRRIQNP